MFVLPMTPFFPRPQQESDNAGDVRVGGRHMPTQDRPHRVTPTPSSARSAPSPRASHATPSRAALADRVEQLDAAHRAHHTEISARNLDVQEQSEKVE